MRFGLVFDNVLWSELVVSLKEKLVISTSTDTFLRKFYNKYKIQCLHFSGKSFAANVIGGTDSHRHYSFDSSKSLGSLQDRYTTHNPGLGQHYIEKGELFMS